MARRPSPALYWCGTIHLRDPQAFSPAQYAELIEYWTGLFTEGRREATPNYKYFIINPEVGGNTDRNHLQFYLELSRKMRLDNVRQLPLFTHELLRPAHVEARRGSAEDARNYCMKESIFGPDQYQEFGVWNPVVAGQRTDLEAVAQLVRSGSSDSAIASEFGTAYIKFHRGIQALRLTIEPQRRDRYSRVLFYGPSRTGKTFRARYAGDPDPATVWCSPVGSLQWFDGVGPHIERAVCDEFAGARSQISLASLLGVLDVYPQRVPTKGGHTWWNPGHIFVTSNQHPRLWYDYDRREGDFDALRNRFTSVLVWPERLPGEHRNFVVISPDDPGWDSFWAGPQPTQPRLPGVLALPDHIYPYFFWRMSADYVYDAEAVINE